MNSAESFSADYAEARIKFREAAKRRAGRRLGEPPDPPRAWRPDGGDLIFTGMSPLFGPRDAERAAW